MTTIENLMNKLKETTDRMSQEALEISKEIKVLLEKVPPKPGRKLKADKDSE